MVKRDYLRVSPSTGAPVEVSLSLEGLRGPEDPDGADPFLKVRNISAGGVMIQISDAMPGRDGLLPAGRMLNNIQLSLPGQGTCVLAGIVRFSYGSLRGIEFLPNEREQKKLARYVRRREEELQGEMQGRLPW